MDELEPIEYDVTVPLPAEAAFSRFVDELGEWWPPEYTWSGEVLERIGIEARPDGSCFELGPHGFRCDWGRVVHWQPPEELGFTWQIGAGREPVPDAERAGVVELRFDGGEKDTRVGLRHHGFERYGEGAAGYRDAMASDQGWPYILGRFVRV